MKENITAIQSSHLVEAGKRMTDPLIQYQTPVWIVFLSLTVFLLIASEFGFRIGVWRRQQHGGFEDTRSDITLTSMLALLGLMLAFTYSFSMSRADLRKIEFIKESNALGTAFKRADLLVEPGRTKLRQILYDYAQSRPVDVNNVRTLGQLQTAIDRSLEIQAKIWPATKAALQESKDMSGAEKALLVSSINDLLDSHTSKVAVSYDRLPTVVLVLLVLTAAGSLSLAAYNYGAAGRLKRWRLNIFALILATLIYIILDYDMALRGLIRIDTKSLSLTIEEMRSEMEL